MPYLAPLPGWDDAVRALCVTTLARIGGEPALSVLESYAPHAGPLAMGALVRAWTSFEAAPYAHRVLAPLLSGQALRQPAPSV